MEHNMSQNEFALDIRGLSVEYRTDEGTVKALNGLNLSIKKGTSLGLVGETGAGKTTTGLSILKLIPDPPGKIVNGSIDDLPGSHDLLGPNSHCRGSDR